MMVPDPALENIIYPWSIVKPVVAGINLLDSQTAAIAHVSTVASPRATMEIVRGCDGAGVMFLMIAAIIAFPARLRSKIVGIGIGLALIVVANLVRLVGLYFVLAYATSWFVPLHVYVFPMLLLLFAGVYFSAWVKIRS